MKKNPREWKTLDLKRAPAVNHFQHENTVHPPSLPPFSFPHLRTLRNQAHLNVTAHTLPTHGSHRQPALVSVPKVSEISKTAVVTPQVTHPRATVHHREVKITIPKKPSPKVQERPLPQLLPPLPGRISEDCSGEDSDCRNDNSSSDESDIDEEEVYEEEMSESVNNLEAQITDISSKFNCKLLSQRSLKELFPATLMQVHQLMDMEQLGNVEFSNKVDNIVRGMKIHGPLNVNSLSKALEQVIKLHHILTIRALHTKECYMLQSSSDNAKANLSVVHGDTSELPTNMLAQERRRPFKISIKNDTSLSCDNTSPTDMHMRVTSVTENDNITNNWTYNTLVRAKLLQYSPQDHLLVLSFSRLVCDYWSSCLFLQQLSKAYAQLETGMQASRMLTKTLRDDSLSHFITLGDGKRLNRSFPGTRTAFVQTASKLQPIRQPNLTTPLPTRMKHHNNPIQSNQLHFQQIAIFEQELLSLISKEKLWSFWQATVTAIIKRTLGLSRLKVVPPVRLPCQLGEGKLRPKTSKSRPLTARRNKILVSEKNNPPLGLVTSFHFIKVEEAICTKFKSWFLKLHVKDMPDEEVLHLMCLAGFVLLLGHCCRGWTPKYNPNKTQQQTNLFDVGSFLIGVEVSLRQVIPEKIKYLIGPLTNDTAIRVNLSASNTFTDLVISLWKSVCSARNHSHFPFSTVAHDLDMPITLPIKFSYLSQNDVIQLTNPQDFYFVETAVGVEGHGLARFGSSCYLTPINSKLDDHCYLELMMWENVDSRVVGGGFRYHNHVIAPDVIAKFGKELCQLLALTAQDPNRTLSDLAEQINPPFSHRRPAYQVK